jgi:NDP-sugar pyrophosphorylase family protein
MSAPRALVLTAGRGTRLQPLTYVRAKAAVPVNGETLARRAVRWLVSHGISDLVLNLHHRPASIAASVGDGSDMGARVRYSWEQPLLGSAGGPRHALPLLVGPERRTSGGRTQELQNGQREAHPSSGLFVIVNGDTLTDVDLTRMRQHHCESGALVTLAVIPNPRPDKYGGVVVSRSGTVTGFTRAGATTENYHFIGVQCVDAQVFWPLPDGVPAESVNGLYKEIIASGREQVGAFVCNAGFQDIGTPADYLRTSVQLAGSEGDRLTAGSRIDIAASALILSTAVWDDVAIGPHATLIECVVGDGARVPAYAHYERCAIVPAGTRAAALGERIESGLLIRSLD